MGLLNYVPQKDIDKIRNKKLKVGSSCTVTLSGLKKYANVIWEGIGPAGWGTILKERGEGVEKEYYIEVLFNDRLTSYAVRTFWAPFYVVNIEYSLSSLYFKGFINMILMKFKGIKGYANTMDKEKEEEDKKYKRLLAEIDAIVEGK